MAQPGLLGVGTGLGDTGGAHLSNPAPSSSCVWGGHKVSVLQKDGDGTAGGRGGTGRGHGWDRDEAGMGKGWMGWDRDGARRNWSQGQGREGVGG